MHLSIRFLICAPLLLDAGCFNGEEPEEVGENSSSGTADSGSMDSDTDPPPPMTTTTTGGGGADDTTTGDETTGSTGDDDSTTGEDVEPVMGAIWVASTDQRTVSRINTETMVEEGRYFTREFPAEKAPGGPVQTSVSLSGDVVVSDSAGGLTKFHANEADCADDDMNGMVDTSKDHNALGWDVEECRAWDIDADLLIPGLPETRYESQRPVAWNAEEQIWTAGVYTVSEASAFGVTFIDSDYDPASPPSANIAFREITGIIPSADSLGFAMGVVDAEGDFWVALSADATESADGAGRVVEITSAVDPMTGAISLDHEIHVLSLNAENVFGTEIRGMTYGSEDVFVCGSAVGRLDPATGAFGFTANGLSNQHGCIEDDQMRLWQASDSLAMLSTNDLGVDDVISLPEALFGVAYDYNGYVWGVAASGHLYRVDPETNDIQFLELEPGADGTPVTGSASYGDMTGFSLARVSGNL